MNNKKLKYILIIITKYEIGINLIKNMQDLYNENYIAERN
jgi:hypothetical protein